MGTNKTELFRSGATWLRADFHLHTRADKEFTDTDNDNSYISRYIAAVKSKGINIGAITNHNKFDCNEFKALRKVAFKEQIFFLPGVELSVNNGANGIHTLVVFSDEWIANGQDYINQFLNVAFEGKTPNQYEQENGRSSLGLIETIKNLKATTKISSWSLLMSNKRVVYGSGIREATFRGIVDEYQDFLAIYTDFDNAKKYFGSNPQNYVDLFLKNLKALLTYQTPNRFTITYRGKELQHHSLGQRASALILFVLSQRDNDLVVIDQPKDDLDNQTIYEDVIKLVRRVKPRVQFIFATHNPNIPVLGDAEQIHACSFSGDVISVQSASIDDHTQQKTIVEIMEGGREAFNRRKEIYTIWKP